MKCEDAMLGIAVMMVGFFAFHNPFGLWEFFGLLATGVSLALAVAGILLFIIKRKGLDEHERN